MLDAIGNAPRVWLNNASDSNASVLEVDNADKMGTLLEIVQVVMDMNLIIRRAYTRTDTASDWFLVVVYIADQNGMKLSDTAGVELKNQILLRLNNEEVAEQQHNTAIELIGRDRPSVLSEIFAVLATHNCNVAAAHVWTHNSRMAAVIYFTDNIGVGGGDAPRQIIMEALLSVLRSGGEGGSERVAVLTPGTIEPERRLHQLMSAADRDGDVEGDVEHFVKITILANWEYALVTLKCPDRPKLHFDTIFALTDMEYMICHGAVVPDGPDSLLQDHYIRHKDGYQVLNFNAERQNVVINRVEAAIKRRSSTYRYGVKLELNCLDRMGFLEDVTRILREHGLSIVRAEVATRDSEAVDVFYVKDFFSGSNQVDNKTIESVRNELGPTINLRVIQDGN